MMTPNSICFMKLFSPPHRVYAFRTVVSSDCSLNQYEVTLFLLSFVFGLEFILSDLRAVTPACSVGAIAWGLFIHPFTRRRCLYFVVRCTSWREQINCFCFLIQSTNRYVLVGEFRATMFRVIIEICVFRAGEMAQ